MNERALIEDLAGERTRFNRASGQRLTPVQKRLLEMLQRPGAYLSQLTRGQYQLMNSGRRVHGVPLDPIVYHRTIQALRNENAIIWGRRVFYGVQHVGYFAADDSQPSAICAPEQTLDGVKRSRKRRRRRWKDKRK